MSQRIPECDLVVAPPTARTLYVAPLMHEWEAGIDAPLGSPGMLVVFDSMAALLEVYPDVDPRTVMQMEARAWLA